MNKPFIFFPLLLMFCSCGNIVSGVKEMSTLNKELKDQFNFTNTKIDLNNGSSIKLSLINTPYNDSSDEVKQTLADTIGAMCIRCFTKTKITAGTVIFAEQSNYGIVHTSHGQGYSMNIGR